jgi:long-chain fatty acid transport protein
MAGRRFPHVSFVAILGALLAARSVEGSGAILYEFGTPDVGLASAGWSARAEDASTLFKNPAGMSILQRSEVQLGAQLLYADMGFEPDANTTVSGSDGGNPIGVFPGGGLFYVQKLPLNLSAGLGAFSYFGLAQKYESDWVGRYYYQEGALVGMTFMPSLSWQPFKFLSVGAGLNAMYGVFKEKLAIHNLLDQPDGQLEIDDSTWGFGANVGVMVTPVEGTRIGATYLSPVKLDFSDHPSFTGLGPGLEAILGAKGLLSSRLDLGMEVPQTAMLSIYQKLGEKWAVMADFGWQQWSQFGMMDVTVAAEDTNSLTVDRHYKDTYHGAVGAEYMFHPRWTLTGGFAYDSSPVDDSDRTVDFAVGQTYRFGLGVLWQTTEAIQLGFAYQFQWLGDLPIDQQRGPLAGRVSGEVSDAMIHFFAFNLSYRFGGKTEAADGAGH